MEEFDWPYGVAFVALLIVLAWIVPARAQFDPQHPGVKDAVRVVDGDTIAIGGTTYRLVGYNTPEIYAITNPCPAEVVAGRIASRLLREMAPELQVEAVPCWDGRAKDRYGRTCGRATYRGSDVAVLMINQGLAEPLPTDHPQALKDWCKRPK